MSALRRRSAAAITTAEATVADAHVLVETSIALRGQAMITRCAWCDRYLLGGRWVTPHSFIRRIRTRVTHGICPDCVADLRANGKSA